MSVKFNSNFRVASLVVALFVLSVPLVFAAGSSEGEAAKPVTLEMAVIAVTGYVNGVDETTLPKEEWTFSKILREFEEANPGIKVEFSVIPDQTTFHQSIKANALAGSGPDIVNLWAGTYVSSLADILLPLNELMPPEDLDNIYGWEALTDTLTSPADGGTVLGYPLGGNEAGIMLYNKALVESAGLDFEIDPPETIDEFLEALDTIQAAGIQPIIAADSGYNSLVSFVFSKWWAQSQGLDHLNRLSRGEEKFVDDEAFLTMFRTLNFMYEQGYINEDYAVRPDATADFHQGNSALFATGNWSINGAHDSLGDDLGVLEVPDLNDSVDYPGMILGGVGQSLCLMEYTEHPKEAVALLSFLSSRENSIRMGQTLSKFPLRYDITIEDMGWTGSPVMEQVFAMVKNAVTWHEFAMDPELVNETYRYGTLAVIGSRTPKQIAVLLDEKAAELNR